MFLVIFLNTLTRLRVLSHFLENLLSLSSSRMNLVPVGKQECLKKKVSLHQSASKRRKGEGLVFHIYKEDGKKIRHTTSKQVKGKRFSLSLLH